MLLRDFKTSELARHADCLRQAAAATVEAFPGARIEIAQRQQYRNMAEGLAREPRAVAYAQEALGGWAGRPSWRSSAAEPTARGSPSWAFPRPTSPPASTRRTRRWNGPAWRRSSWP